MDTSQGLAAGDAGGELADDMARWLAPDAIALGFVILAILRLSARHVPPQLTAWMQ